MQFNVHHWNGKEWVYIATTKATNEDEAARMVSCRFSLKGRFSSFPHIDNYDDRATAKTSFTEVI